MNFRLLVGWCLVFFGGCVCGVLPPGERFACDTDVECGEGFVCGDVEGARECVVSRDAGAGGGGGVLDAGTGGGAVSPADAGTGGGSQGVAVHHLAVVVERQRVGVTTCATLELEARDAQDQPVPTTAAFSLNVSSTGVAVRFFADAACGDSGPLVFPAGVSRARLSFRSETPGEAVLVVQSPYATVSQVVSFEVGPTALSLSANALVVVQAGQCLRVTATSTLAGQPRSPLSDVELRLTSVPAGAMRFFSDAACSAAPVTSVPWRAEEGSVVFFVRPLSGGTLRLEASTPFASASLSSTVLPAVRRGTCTLSGTSSACPISPPQVSTSRTALFFQARVDTGSLSLDPARVMCSLEAIDRVRCSRASASADDVTISWQTLELPDLTVVRRTGACGPGAVPWGTSLNLASTFVLKALEGTGNQFDDDDVRPFVMTSAAEVSDLSPLNASPCDRYELQGVQLPGLVVSRGSIALSPGQAEVTTQTPGLVRSAVLTQVSTPASSTAGDTAGICEWLVRGEVTTGGQLRFRRGAGSSSCAALPLTVHYEQLDFSGRASQVLQRTVAFSGGQKQVALQLPALDFTRTLLLPSSMIGAGLSTGEVESVGIFPVDDPSPAMATFEVTATGVTAQRDAAGGAALHSVTVVELTP